MSRTIFPHQLEGIKHFIYFFIFEKAPVSTVSKNGRQMDGSVVAYAVRL